MEGGAGMNHAPAFPPPLSVLGGGAGPELRQALLARLGEACTPPLLPCFPGLPAPPHPFLHPALEPRFRPAWPDLPPPPALLKSAIHSAFQVSHRVLLSMNCLVWL